MADAASTPAGTHVVTNDGLIVVTWAGALNGVATGGIVSLPRIKPGSMSVQFTGTFGGGTYVFGGSNDGVNFVTCRYARSVAVAGTQDAVSVTAADAGKVLDDAFRYYRMTSSGGTGSAVITTLVAKRD